MVAGQLRSRPMTRASKPFSVKPWKPGDGDREANRTPAQIAATRRNFEIARVRSLWTLCYVIRTSWRRRLIQWLIDGELSRRGAEPHGARVKRQTAERDAEWARMGAAARTRDFDLSDMPF